MEGWLPALINTAGVIAAALVSLYSARTVKKTKADMEREKRRASVRAEEAALSMDLASATCALAVVIAKKVNGLHTNGDVEAAMHSAEKALNDYTTFVERTAARQFTKV